MSDSTFRPGSDDEWEALLQQLRQQTAAAPAPVLYGRVRAQLTAPAASPWAWLRRPAYALALGLLVVAVSGDGAAATPTRQLPYPVQQVLP